MFTHVGFMTLYNSHGRMLGSCLDRSCIHVKLVYVHEMICEWIQDFNVLSRLNIQHVGLQDGDFMSRVYVSIYLESHDVMAVDLNVFFTCRDV